MLKSFQKLNYIIVLLFVVTIGFIMSFLSMHSETVRQAQSDYSEGWSADGMKYDIDSIVTSRFDGAISVSKALPDTLRYNDSLCFMSTNSFFDVYIEDEQVYSFTQPVNFTGYGYGNAYHAINLSPEDAGKIVQIDMRGVAPGSVLGGRIRLLSIEDAGNYSGRIARGQIFSFLISGGIALLGILLLFFSLIAEKVTNSIDIPTLGITAVISGTWMAVDTGFLRLTANAIIPSRVLSYLCMHICFLPLVLFVYSQTEAKKKVFKITALVLSGIYYALILVWRFVFGQDMAYNTMIRCFFIYALLILALLIAMIAYERRYNRKRGIKRDVQFFMVGFFTVVLCALTDSIIYACGIRSISGYASFSRVGCFIFFLNMSIEVVRNWVREYASLREYGFEDVLTEVGNRRAFLEFEKENRNTYPYGLILCDINALKRENDLNGHDAGDRLIKNVAGQLADVFGSENVFRVGGDEFVAYSFEPTEEGFRDKTEQARKLLSKKEASASIGGVYVPDASLKRNEARKKAEAIMYAEKESYYVNNNDRRR
ncbi:MAG: GGDEF domain-containing protein [Lachnospiraceae bacterium]|nr:GGDEF domain-containing protein [Lachnospiraceae bacterium]